MQMFLFSLIMMIFRLLIQAAKVLLKIIWFTGLWVTIILAFLSEYFIHKYFPGLKDSRPHLFTFIDIITAIICFAPAVYITINNLLRFVTSNRSFSLFGSINDKIVSSKENKSKTKKDHLKDSDLQRQSHF